MASLLECQSKCIRMSSMKETHPCLKLFSSYTKSPSYRLLLHNITQYSHRYFNSLRLDHIRQKNLQLKKCTWIENYALRSKTILQISYQWFLLKIPKSMNRLKWMRILASHPILIHLKSTKQSPSRSLCRITAWFFSSSHRNSQQNQVQWPWPFRHNSHMLVASLTKPRLETISFARLSRRQGKSQPWSLLALQRVITTCETSTSRC